MTTMTRTWSNIKLALGAFIITAAVAGTAMAEDPSADFGKAQPQYAQPHAHAQQSYDQQYKMPQSYNGKYYPDDESAIGYHGTATSAQNTQTTGNTPYYYYY